ATRADHPRGTAGAERAGTRSAACGAPRCAGDRASGSSIRGARAAASQPGGLMRLVRDLRLIPVVALAAAALFLLKVSAIVIEGGYTLIASRAALAQGLGEGATAKDDEMPPPAPLEETSAPPRGDRARSWVRDIYAPAEYTAWVASPTPDAPAPSASPPTEGAAAAPTAPEMPKPSLSAGERAVLESLAQRRQELETRAREMEVRESLLKAAEKRIELRLQELKETEARLTGIASKK